MLSARLESGVNSQSHSSPAACIHCGLPIPASAHLASSRFCCHGCEIAYAILQEDEELQQLWQSRPQQQDQVTYAEMDHAAFAERYVEHKSDRVAEIELAVENIYCASCVFAIEKLPRFLPGVLESRLNLTTSRLKVTWLPQQVPLSEIARALDKLGYPPHPVDDQSLAQADRIENRNRLIHLAVAGVCAGNAMLVAIAMYYGLFSGMESGFANLFRWVSALLAVLSLTWPGRTFFQNAFRAVRTRTPHMDLPVALGLSAGMTMGLVNTALGRGEIYFDSITVLVFLLLVGRYLQYGQQRKAIRQVSLLNSLTPHSVRRAITADVACDEFQVVPLTALQVGDIIEVRIGDLLPADGRIVKGDSTIDCSILTGESAGQAVHVGDEVSAGTTNLSAPLVVQVERTAAQTRLAEITRLVEAGIQSKTPIVQFANAIAGYFVAVVLLLAVITFAAWAPFNVEQAVNHAMALLIVACPCALGLATPFTIAIAQARAARQQILIKSGDVLEKLRRPGAIWLDKTGTMTEGRPRLIAWEGDEICVPGVMALESQTVHPLATALTAELRKRFGDPDRLDVANVQSLSGLGVRGCVDGRDFLVGSPKLIEAYALHISHDLQTRRTAHEAGGHTTIIAAVDGTVVAIAALGDRVRPETAATIRTLTDQGWNVGVLSGDNPGTVAKVAQEVGLPRDRCFGHISPEEKLARIQAAPSGETTVMVGDGVNDSAALAASSVGIAVQGGAAVSLQAADVYLSHSSLAGILRLIQGARQTVRTIHFNFAASLTYNLTAAALAMTGYVNPIVAAVLMPLSSLTVLLIAFLNPAFRRTTP